MVTTEVVLCDAPEVGEARGKVFLPIVANGATLGADPIAAALGNDMAYAFYELLWNDTRQQRPRMSVCPHLVMAAKLRALGLASGDPFAHADSRGVTANEYASNAGCHLPPYYAVKGNQIETLVAGSPNMQVMFDALAASEKHANHMFGRVELFRKQDKVGIGVGVGGAFGWYLCLLISECLDE